MKIGLDVSQTCVEIGGCGWIAHQLAMAMSGLSSPQKEIILYHHFGNWVNANTNNGVRSVASSVSSPLLNMDHNNAQLLWKEIEIGTAQLPGEPNIIHSHNFSAPNTGSVPLVYTVHDLAFWDLPGSTTETNRLICQNGIIKSLSNARAFVFPSQFTRLRFLEFFSDIVDKNEQHTAVVQWAGRFTPRNKPKYYSSETPWIFVGSLDPRKNIRNMLQAYERYREKSSICRQLFIAGPRGWKTEFEASHIKSLTRRGWVKHLGYLDDPMLAKLYRDAFALVWPSFYEGFGLPIVEAMSQGTPVITSNRTSMPEVGGAAAIYCDPESVESISDAMLSLENNEHQYAAFSKDSLQQSSKFSWETAAGKLFDFYEKVISSK